MRPEVAVRRRIRLALAFALLCGAPAAGQQQRTERAWPMLHGFLFGDVTFAASEQETREGFVIGQLVGHGNVGLSERLHLFIELSATARSTGYLFEVERAILRYDFVDAFKLSVGRYHTPVAYWNTAMHHGLWLQTSVARPEQIRTGGVFLPNHFIGVLAEGVVNSPVVTVGYEAGVGNGRDTSIGRAGDAGDVNATRAGVLAVRLRPAAPLGLQVGGSIYLDRVALETTAADERIASAHVVWDRGAPELIAEYANVQHEPAGGGASTSSDGYYVHAAVRLPGGLSPLKPYGRYERIDIDDADLVFTPLIGDYRAMLLGVRWDFETLATLKLEGRRERLAGADWQNSLYVQFAFVVPSYSGM
jgi:hypothetical protein